MTAEPWLSIVVTSRNDDHGGDLLHRCGAFLGSLLHQARLFDLPLEVVMVEWNPPEDRPRLHEVLPIPLDLSPVRLRFVEVPAGVHRTLANPHGIPLFQMAGKNVGIRRASGRFVLSTCNDLLFSDELMWFLSLRRLREDRLYRADRYDLSADRLPDLADHDRLLAFCAEHVSGICGNRNQEGRSVAPFPGSAEEFRALSPEELDAFLALGEDRATHSNACGDFTLMSREAWFAMRGYPEIPLGDLYVDGLGLHQGLSLGLVQSILADPMRVYHIHHALSSSGGGHLQRLRVRPSISHNRDYLPWCRTLREERAPLNPNGPLWGMADLALPELRME